jgi:hypothetical protein
MSKFKYEFVPEYKKELFKFESQDRVPHDKVEEFEDWVKLGFYERTSPGRKMSFEVHGEALGIESQEEWDKHVAEYEEEMFAHFSYGDRRIAEDRDMGPVLQSDVDEIGYWRALSLANFEWHVADMETNGTDSVAHQDWLVRKERGHGPDLDYFIRDDIIAHETTPEFEAYRKGISRGYDVGLADVAHVEAQVPELVEIRDRLREELIQAVVAFFVSEWNEEPDEDLMELMRGKYVMDKPIAKLVYMIQEVKKGNLVT